MMMMIMMMTDDDEGILNYRQSPQKQQGFNISVSQYLNLIPSVPTNITTGDILSSMEKIINWFLFSLKKNTKPLSPIHYNFLTESGNKTRLLIFF